MYSDNFIRFTPAKVVAFRKAYEHARENELSQFMFEGKVILTDLAFYVLTYLEPKFASKR